MSPGTPAQSRPGCGCVFWSHGWRWKWKITARDSYPRQRARESASWPCGSGHSCWRGRLNFPCRPPAVPWFVCEFREKNRRRMANKISVLLVDDHALVRRGFRRILEDEPDITVAGEASTGEEAVKLAGELSPQVIIMDCALPGINGLQATRQILKKSPQTLVLMLSMHPEETWV